MLYIGIIERYACGRTKIIAIAHEVVYHTRDTIIKHLKTNVFSLATDGSNEVSDKLYPLVVIIQFLQWIDSFI